MQVLDDANTNNDVTATDALKAFINAVEAQRGKKILETDTDARGRLYRNFWSMQSYHRLAAIWGRQN